MSMDTIWAQSQVLASVKLTIEKAIDAHGLDNVLSAIATICEEKRDHISENWQDSALAAKWGKCAARIDTCAGQVAQIGRF